MDLTEEEKEALLQENNWGFSLRPKVIPPKEEYSPKHLKTGEKSETKIKSDE